MAVNGTVEERQLAYLAQAADARTAALNAQDWEARETWQKIADGWQLLADQTSRAGKM